MKTKLTTTVALLSKSEREGLQRLIHQRETA